MDNVFSPEKVKEMIDNLTTKLNQYKCDTKVFVLLCSPSDYLFLKERFKEELENDTLKIHPIYDCQKGKIYFMDSKYLNLEYQGDKPIFKIPLSAQMYDIGEDECDD